jgi:hypothetical protein
MSTTSAECLEQARYCRKAIDWTMMAIKKKELEIRDVARRRR